MNAEIRVPTSQLVVGQPLDRSIYPEAPDDRSTPQIVRQCGTNPEHGFFPKVVKEIWAPDRSSLTLTNREVCNSHGCTNVLPPFFLSLADIRRIAREQGNYVVKESCRPPKSIQF